MSPFVDGQDCGLIVCVADDDIADGGDIVDALDLVNVVGVVDLGVVGDVVFVGGVGVVFDTLVLSMLLAVWCCCSC